MDVHTPEMRSYNMSRIRGADTKPEMLLRKALWAAGYRYRLKVKLPGKPDLVFISKKIAIFVDGCYWHGCPKHASKPKTNVLFWEEKLDGNIERDKRVNRDLVDRGWKVLRLWEHEIKNDLPGCVDKIAKVYRGADSINYVSN